MVNGQPAIEKGMNASVIKILFAVVRRNATWLLCHCSPLK
jgi:hypothetical protein